MEYFAHGSRGSQIPDYLDLGELALLTALAEDPLQPERGR